MHVCMFMYLGVLAKQEECVGSPGAGVAGSVTVLCRCCEPDSSLLEGQQQALAIAEL